MKRIIALVLCLVVVIGCTSCRRNDGNDPQIDEPFQEGEENQIYPVPDHLEEAAADNPVTYMIISTVRKVGEPISLAASLDENGQGHVEYTGREKKVATFEPEVLNGITARLKESGLEELNGRAEEHEGDHYASLYVEYGDGSTITADFTGEVPEEFMQGYSFMEEYFEELTEKVPVYVPQPEVTGTVDRKMLAEMKKILTKSDLEALDTLVITDVPLDENFAQAVGLSSAEGITGGTSCAPMMLSTAYSFVIVTVGDEDDTDDVCEDFIRNMDWDKWVCVSASHGLVAEKDNMALCLMGTGDYYEKTAAAVKAAGWDDIEKVSNPDM